METLFFILACIVVMLGPAILVLDSLGVRVINRPGPKSSYRHSRHARRHESPKPFSDEFVASLRRGARREALRRHKERERQKFLYSRRKHWAKDDRQRSGFR